MNFNLDKSQVGLLRSLLLERKLSAPTFSMLKVDIDTIISILDTETKSSLSLFSDSSRDDVVTENNKSILRDHEFTFSTPINNIHVYSLRENIIFNGGKISVNDLEKFISLWIDLFNKKLDYYDSRSFNFYDDKLQ